ncbi:response regulator transcription factor [Petrocella sp. FN5]|uniref:response regulator transcription factor n=1 Tax=Petrocella sp. FN5 TaxID=3032002 RepID=UPI0023DB7685|nr:response regulator [Petrocella sp. FN5]MDF1617284.1 response regulator [Petrocella sp. FN5]
MEKYKILIVDDESIEREAIKFILNKELNEDLEFYEAANGQEAISSAALNSPNIIVMDIQMPGLNGIEAVKVLKKILADSKVIFLTAYDQFDYAHEAIKLGVEDFIVKPASNERLVEVINRAIKTLKDEKQQAITKEMMASKLEQVSKYLENEFLSSVINGDIENEQGKEYLDFNGIKFECGMGIVVRANADEAMVSSGLRLQVMRRRLLDAIDTRINKIVRQKYSTIIKDYIYIFIMGERQNELLQIQEKIRKILNEVGSLFALEHQLYSDFGIGDICNKLDCLWKSFSTAKANCNKRIPTRDSRNEQDLQALVKSLKDKDEAAFNKYIDLLFEDISSGSEDLEMIRIKLYEHFVLIRERVSDNIYESDIYTFDLFNQTMKISNHHEAKYLLRDFCNQYMEKLDKQKSDKTSIILDKLIVYINLHYAENITLDQLSSICDLSPSYISKVFKKHLNTNFIDYVSSVRIIVAKRLLKNSLLSIKEIGYEIGYFDSNYFTRVFKKYEGMTPSDYRNKWYNTSMPKKDGDEVEADK